MDHNKSNKNSCIKQRTSAMPSWYHIWVRLDVIGLKLISVIDLQKNRTGNQSSRNYKPNQENRSLGDTHTLIESCWMGDCLLSACSGGACGLMRAMVIVGGASLFIFLSPCEKTYIDKYYVWQLGGKMLCITVAFWKTTKNEKPKNWFDQNWW